MKDNAINISGTDVYLNNIYALADQFVDEELNGKQEDVSDNFLQMIFYIADRIEKPNNDDIELLNAMFDVFVRLCVKYKKLPTLEAFSFLVRINKCTFSDWANGEYRKQSSHGKSVKTWLDTCKSFTIERLHNDGRTNVNLIFTAKANYGMRETSPLPAEQIDQIPHLDREQIAARYKALQLGEGAPEEHLDLE